jgi:hypothetical protein
MAKLTAFTIILMCVGFNFLSGGTIPARLSRSLLDRYLRKVSSKVVPAVKSGTLSLKSLLDKLNLSKEKVSPLSHNKVAKDTRSLVRKN